MSNGWKGLAQGLFKYQIRFSIALAVSEIWLDKHTPLFKRFLAIFGLFFVWLTNPKWTKCPKNYPKGVTSYHLPRFNTLTRYQPFKTINYFKNFEKMVILAIFGHFWHFLAYFSYNWPTQSGPNFPKLTQKVSRDTLYLRLIHQVDIIPLRALIFPKSSKKWLFLSVFFQSCAVAG